MDVDQIFCSNQIVIPPMLPSILKKYAKAAIRTQPYDLLVWSAAYFKAMATGGTPPIKMRLEFPLPENSELTLGYVKLLVYQFGKVGEVKRVDLVEKWKDVCLPDDLLGNILRIGSFAHTVDWQSFVAISLGFLEKSLKGTMIRVCEVLTEEPDGGSSMISSQLFIQLYRYLGGLNCGEGEAEIEQEVKTGDVVEPDDKAALLTSCLDQDSDIISTSAKDIDSVIREIGDGDSVASVDTRLGGAEENNELDWPNIEASGSEITEKRVSSEPSDEGANSDRGLEVFVDEADYEAGLETVQRKEQEEDVKPTLNIEEDEEEEDEEEKEMVGEVKEVVEEPVVEDEKADEPGEDEHVAEENISFFRDEGAQEVDVTIESAEDDGGGSGRVVLEERQAEDEGSERDSEIEDNVRKNVSKLTGEESMAAVSISDLRTTADRETRKRLLQEGLEDEETRKQRLLVEEETTRLRIRIEQEAIEKFHMYVPGIGVTLPPELMDKVEEYLSSCADRQSGMVMPRNLRHFLCPPLDLECLDRSQGLDELLEDDICVGQVSSPDMDSASLVEVIQHNAALDVVSSLGDVSGESIKVSLPSQLSVTHQSFSSLPTPSGFMKMCQAISLAQLILPTNDN